MIDEVIKLKIRDGNTPEEISWQIEEPDHLPKNAEWFWALGILALALIVFSILLKNYLLIIIVALASLVIYVRKNKRRELIDFRLDNDGLHIDRKFYSYENFESFFIFPAHIDLESGTTTLGEREVAFRFKKSLIPLLIVPFHNNDETSVRKIINKYLEENEEKESFIDLLRKKLF